MMLPLIKKKSWRCLAKSLQQQYQSVYFMFSFIVSRQKKITSEEKAFLIYRKLAIFLG